jgi:hypothetical protein
LTETSQPLPRFDGAAAWAELTAEDQAAIGATALEYIVNLIGEETYFTGLEAKPEARPFIAAAPIIIDNMREAVTGALCWRSSALTRLPVPIPSLLGPVCRVCLCSEDDGCAEGCGWAEADLCTSCAARGCQPPSEGSA